MKKYLVLKEEYEGQIISVVLPGMGKVKINTDKIKGDKSFYIKNGLGYLFEEVSITYDNWDSLISDLSDGVIAYLDSIGINTYRSYLEFDKNVLNGSNVEDYVKSLNIEPEIDEVIDLPIEEEKVEEVEDKPVKKKGGRPRKK
jgi:hypothetical protein